MSATAAIPPANVGLNETQAAFIDARRYLGNVSPKTVEWYKQSFVSFAGCVTPAEYKARVVALRARGTKAISVNTWVRCLNAYQHWLWQQENLSERDQRKCSPYCTHFKLAKLKVDSTVLVTFSPEQSRRILGNRKEWARDATGKRKVSIEHGLSCGVGADRAQVLCAVLLDTGLRLTEALQLRRGDVDMDNQLVTVMGKGRKERIVPMSTEGRKWFYRWMQTNPGARDGYVFATSTGKHLGKRAAERDITNICLAAGIEGVRCSPHTFRHTFAISYLKASGNLEYLRRILGHSSITITQQYLKSLKPEDIGAVHNTMSPLSRLGA